MTQPSFRDMYLAWTRRVLPVLMLPLVFTAVLQAASAGAWWSVGPKAEGAVRYLFIAVGVASVMMGRSVRARDTAAPPLATAAIVSLSWRLVVYALAPSAIGAVLAFMTRQMGDYFLLLIVSLAGLALLYPRYDQWVAWSSRPPVIE